MYEKRRCEGVSHLDCHTLPEELAEASYEQQSAFFEATTNFLNDRYGQENAVAAVVHYDETTPHLHYAFVPVVFDDKKSRYKRIR